MNINPEKIDKLVNIFITMDENTQEDLIKKAEVMSENLRLKNEILAQDKSNKQLSNNNLEDALCRKREEKKQEITELVKMLKQLKQGRDNDEYIDAMAVLYIELLNRKRELLAEYHVKIELEKKSRNIQEAVKEIFPTVNYKNAMELWKTTRSKLIEKGA